MTTGGRPARRGRSRGTLAWLGAALLVLAGGVACVPTSPNPFAPAGTAETEILIHVENRGFNEFRLYAMSARGAQSLGVIPGNTQQRLNLAWRQLDQLGFRIEVLAGRTYSTYTVTASPGDRVELIVPANPAGAQLRVR